MDNCRNRKSSFFGDRGVINLQRSLTDLFGAGSETTTTMILFSFLYMIKYPEIQVRQLKILKTLSDSPNKALQKQPPKLLANPQMA